MDSTITGLLQISTAFFRLPGKHSTHRLLKTPIAVVACNCGGLGMASCPPFLTSQIVPGPHNDVETSAVLHARHYALMIVSVQKHFLQVSQSHEEVWHHGGV